MTEYDYSPAAYDRYMAQQARVSNWVDDTVRQAHAYSNPFVLSPTLRDRTFYEEPEDYQQRHRRNDDWSSSSSRPSRERSRSYADQARYDRSQQASRHRTQSHSRSASTPRDFDIVYQPHHSQPYVYPQPHVVSRTPAPRLHTSPPHNYQYPSPTGQSPTRQAYVTQPPPGQIYHIPPNTHGPPPLHRQPSHSRHSSKPPPQPYLLVQGGGPKSEYKRGPPIHAPVPIKPHGQQPSGLMKRLFNFNFKTSSPVGGRSGNGRGFRGATY